MAEEGPLLPKDPREESPRTPEWFGPAKMSLAWVNSFEKEHLWMYLQALGFDPGPAAVACGKIVSHIHLGV